MKISVINTFNPFEVSNASANRWRTIIEGLANEGVEIHLIITQGFQSINERNLYARHKDYQNGGRIYFHYTIILLQSNLWWRRINTYILSPLLSRINAYITRKFIEKTSPNILLLYTNIEVYRIYANLFRAKPSSFKIMMEIGEYNDIYKIHSTNKLQLLNGEKEDDFFVNKVLPHVDLFVLITQKLVDHYRTLSGNPDAKFLHLPMTVDFKRFKEKFNTNLKRPYLAYVGDLTNKKDGIDIMIHSFARIADEFKEIRLYIVGRTQEDTTMQKEIVENYNLKERIIYLGSRSREEIPPILQNAEALLLARPDSIQAQGGFPTKLGEYLATGNPVCVTRVGEIMNYLTDNVNVFAAEPGSVESFAEAMKRALSNKDVARLVGHNGKRIAEENFNMDIQAKKLYHFLKENI